MADTFHDRIQARIAELDTSLHAVSLAAGLDRGYLTKLIKRRSMPNSGALQKLAAALQMSPEKLLGGLEEDHDIVAAIPKGIRKTRPETQTVAKDLPIRRSSSPLRDDGLFALASATTGWLFRPPALAAFHDAYCFSVPNASLRPQFAPGDLALACPDKPTRKGDPVIIHLRDERDGARSSVGILAEDVGREVILTLHGHDGNTSHEIEEVSSVHKILSLAEILGAGQ